MALSGKTVLKAGVKEHWERETCGTRYGNESDRKLYFDEISVARYQLEPYIHSFADFQSANGKTVLEIGVGAGADFQNWCEYAAHATGVDLTEKAISLTDERLKLNSVPPEKYRLLSTDAENLPFDDNSFDIVYSYGVLHHTPDTYRAFEEVFRVLKPGGSIRAMIYHDPSWTGLMLYVQHALMRGHLNMKMREVVFQHLESPGTKTYTVDEARQFLSKIGFSGIELSKRLGPGDLLMIKPSKKYDSTFFRMIWKIYPRWLVRLIGDRYGLGLFINAGKPKRARVNK
ncbi:MAG TPA: class I SAM-dependent methyltransferase [Blastocatellia bacterium]|nr:class I SAM-dependent methyltransferase [Blastocatellia bacterium]